MDTGDWVVVGALAIGGALLYRQFAPGWSTQTAQNAFTLRGDKAVVTTDAQRSAALPGGALQSSDLVVTSGNTTYFLTGQDLQKLNWAQKILLNTRLVPTGWILG